MKSLSTLIIALFLITNLVSSQDTIYIYKAGLVISKNAVSEIDSITFKYTPPASGTITDNDGNVSQWIIIGTQKWMKENLNSTKFRNGEIISNLINDSEWQNSKFAAWCDFINKDQVRSTTGYGKLYNWYAIIDSRNIAPLGWHVASDSEWTILENYLSANGGNYDGTNNGNKIAKSLASKTDWPTSTEIGSIGNNLSLNNSSGFSALPGQWRTDYGSYFFGVGGGSWWTSTQYNSNSAWNRMLDSFNSNLRLSSEWNKNYGLSVRCIKDALPVLNVTIINSVSSTTASCGGVISNAGGVEIIAKGVCWSTSSNPTINDNKTNNGNGIESFTGSLYGLTKGTTYYVRAYATNSEGTGYGEQVSLTTTTIPTLSTTSISSITISSANTGGYITSTGGAAITATGVCWNTNSNPTIDDNKTNNGIVTGEFISTVSGLLPGTTYYVRAYATNSVGTSYGQQIIFITTTAIPTVTTSAISMITDSTAISGGNVISNGGAGISAKGICWSTSANPTLNDSKTNELNGNITFSGSLTHLVYGTTYYVRAYATNSVGTGYGEQVQFTTTDIFGRLVTDLEGNVYHSVKIGAQTWMVENLKTTRFRNGESIINITDATAWSNSTGPAWCEYNNDSENGSKLGKLYNWNSVIDDRNIAPVGWHIPSDSEWSALENYLIANGYNYDNSTTENKIAKSLAATTDWNYYSASEAGAVCLNLLTNNKTGFNALPAGDRSNLTGISFEEIGNSSCWWSSTAYDETYIWCRSLTKNTSGVYRDYYSGRKSSGHSVRCIKN